MKKTLISILLVICSVVFVCACGRKASAWQEQYDLGVRYLSEGNYEEAIIAFTAVIEIDPRNVAAYLGRANAYIGNGETEENLAAALEDYQSVLELDDTRTDAYLGIEDIYIRQGEYEKAQDILEKGFEKTGDQSIADKLEEIKVGTIKGSDDDLITDETEPTIVSSGYCGGEGDGENLKWELDVNGTLTIRGIGKMVDFEYNAPWKDNGINKAYIAEGVTSIGDNTFNKCTELTSIFMPNSLTSIGRYAFWSCEKLSSIIVPNSVITIGGAAFGLCANLTSVTIPAGVASIGDATFYNCSNLVKIVIPDGVTSVGDWTFGGCEKLTSIAIPNSVTSIDFRAFWGCDNLKDVYYSGSEAEWSRVIICDDNNPLTAATIHFNSTL